MGSVRERSEDSKTETAIKQIHCQETEVTYESFDQKGGLCGPEAVEKGGSVEQIKPETRDQNMGAFVNDHTGICGAHVCRTQREQVHTRVHPRSNGGTQAG